MIDTHCHVHDHKFDHDRAAVMARARAAGVSAMITVGENISDSARAIATAQEYRCFAAAGIHPHDAKDAPATPAEALRPLLAQSPVVALGETGLDYYYDHSPRDAQQRVLRAQLRLARETEMPVIFHHRDAFEDFTAILREEWKSGMRGVVHCFTGTAQQAQTLVAEFGLLLGIGGVVTFANAPALREAVCAAGLDRIVLETDAPYLAPEPMRGKRNEPAFIAHTAARLGEILGVSLHELIATTDRNARTLFGMRAS
ncbi:MAG: TatD family hydrolase [Candidatus Eremiobacteraeota bacterium]|nr:TatD family hydrolase [Candidatus Eremiobacteraeota bacterium]MBV9055312.1 TatD family hydrolase [Candidatus Eremiobacteraeota bacterium]MBV9700992.1 TatD family hydrolase [Candidatus Eremiobacteraeota bacterium]